MVIEASSFQLAYSKFIKPNYALLLNITKDHLDWHGNMQNYIKAKLKVFSLQNKKNYAYLPNNQKIIKEFKKNKIQSSVQIIKSSVQNLIKKNISNQHLVSSGNLENLSFIYQLKKHFKIDDKNFFSSLKKFRGLPHRQEIFLIKKNIFFINDSKATTFESTQGCLLNFKNIIWIVGSLRKKGDSFRVNKIKKNISKIFIIGKDRSFFKKRINKQISFAETVNLKNTMKYVFKELNSMKKTNNKIFVILSPASASYDQFKNFEERGKLFKKLITYHAKKYF